MGINRILLKSISLILAFTFLRQEALFARPDIFCSLRPHPALRGRAAGERENESPTLSRTGTWMPVTEEYISEGTIRDEFGRFPQSVELHLAGFIQHVVRRRLSSILGLEERIVCEPETNQRVRLASKKSPDEPLEAKLEEILFELIKNANDEYRGGLAKGETWRTGEIKLSFLQTGRERAELGVENEGELDIKELDKLQNRLENYARRGKLWRHIRRGDIIVERKGSTDKILERRADEYERLGNKEESLRYMLEYLARWGVDQVLFIPGLSRGKKRETGEVGGKGLGLAICKILSLDLGGNITVDRRRSNRTIFKIILNAQSLDAPFEGEREVKAGLDLRNIYLEVVHLLANNGLLFQEKRKTWPDGREEIIDPRCYDREALGFSYNEKTKELSDLDEDTIRNWSDYDFKDRTDGESKLDILGRIVNHRLYMINRGGLPDIKTADEKMMLVVSARVLGITLTAEKKISEQEGGGISAGTQAEIVPLISSQI